MRGMCSGGERMRTRWRCRRSRGLGDAGGSCRGVQVPYTLRALPLTFRNMASIPKESVTIAARTKTAPGRLLAIRAARAAVHATAATTEIHAADPRSLAVLASATFTTAKMMRKPALPIVEMLSRSSRFASTIVEPAVMNSPSSGSFQPQ